MKINKLGEVLGAVTQENMYEGRGVLITAMSGVYSHNYGSREDLPGVKLPDTSAEAALAFYLVSWAVDNTKPPLYEPYPAISWSLRPGGFDQTVNVPFTAKVRMTQPSVQIGQEIPSGYLCLAHVGGTYTLTSGYYTYSADAVTLGNYLVASNTADDGASSAGLLKYSASAAPFQVIGYDSTSGDLTVRSL
jgi:hypothetical protein